MSKKPQRVKRRVKIQKTQPQALPFVQHQFQNEVELLFETPDVILITREAYARMWHFVDVGQDEVGWLGTVEQLENGSFLIDEVFLLHQEVSGAQTEISEEGISLLTDTLLNTPDGLEKVNKIRFWGHSHVMMGTSPSFQDEEQMNMFKENGCPWFIRGILNKRGRMEFDIFFFERGIVIHDVPWVMFDTVDQGLREEIRMEFDEKVKKRVYAPVSHFPMDPDLVKRLERSGITLPHFSGSQVHESSGFDGDLIEEVRRDLKENGMTVDDIDSDAIPREAIRQIRGEKP